MKKKSHFLKSILKAVLLLVLLGNLAFAGLVAVLTVTEYQPAAKESIAIQNNEGQSPIAIDQPLRILTWNIGYGALGETADFFMDGGKEVRAATKEEVHENLAQIGKEIATTNADVVFLQEVDQNANRSYHINEADTLFSLINNKQQPYNNSFANNFKVSFIPYPIPPIGKVDAGIMTLTQHAVTSATRVQLPVSFDWPVRTANLKRCLLVHRLPINGSDKELVMINLHLEAYDKGEGKLAQTRVLKEVLDKEMAKGNYVIAGGDFNQTFSSLDTSAYPAQEGKWHAGILDVNLFDESWQFLMNNDKPSCRSLDQPYVNADHDTFQYYIIDGFIVSKNLHVKQCETKDLAFRYSDHQPVMMECTFEK